MPMDLSGVHSIIQAYIAGDTARRQEEEAQKGREQELKLQQNLFKQQTQLQKQHEDLLRSQFEAEQKRRDAEFKFQKMVATINAVHSGAIKVPNLATGVPNTPDFSTEGISRENPFGTQIGGTHDVPAPTMDFAGEQIPTNILPTIQDQASRIKALRGAEFDARMPLEMQKVYQKIWEDVLKENLRVSREDEARRQTQEFLRGEHEKDRQNRLDIANRRGSSKTDPMDKPLTPSEAATYGVPIGTRMRDLEGQIPSKPLSSEEEEELRNWEAISELSKEVRSLGNKTSWRVFTPMLGEAQSKLANIGKETEDEARLRSKVGQLRAKWILAMSGKTLTATEKELAQSYQPTLNDKPLRARVKTEDLGKLADQLIARLKGPRTRPATRRPLHLDANGNPVYQ